MPILPPNSGNTGAGGVDPAEAFLFKNDFTAANRGVAESDRDVYYAANPADLIALDANPNWFITLTFIDLGVSTVVAQVRRSGVWATLGGSSGIDFSNMTDGEVAIYDLSTGKLVGRDIFVDETGSLTVGTNSLSLGQVHTMSSGYENVMFRNDITNKVYHPIWQNATEGADEKPIARVYSAPLQNRVVVSDNGDDKTGSVSSPNYTGSPSTNERLFSIYLEAVASITNVVASLIDTSSGDLVYRVDIGDLVANVETEVAFNVPIDAISGVSNRIEIRSDDGIVTLKADVTNTFPWLAFDVQPWADKTVGLVDNLKGGYGSYSDVNTITTPITTTSGVWTNLTNDGNGAATDLLHFPPNVTSLWNVSLNQLDISELVLGDTVTIRADIVNTPSRNNTIIDLELMVNLRNIGGTLLATEHLAFGTEILGQGAGVTYQMSEVKTFGISSQSAIYGEAFIRIRTDRPCDVEVKRFFIGVTK